MNQWERVWVQFPPHHRLSEQEFAETLASIEGWYCHCQQAGGDCPPGLHCNSNETAVEHAMKSKVAKIEKGETPSQAWFRQYRELAADAWNDICRKEEAEKGKPMPACRATTRAWSAMLDNGMFANFPGGRDGYISLSHWGMHPCPC